MMMSLIRSAVVRLTFFYLAIVATLSIGFSVVVYHLSSREFDRSSTPQIVRQLNDLFIGDYRKLQATIADESRLRLKQHLILWNTAIIGLGAIGSYWFARRTLQPIDNAMERQGRFISDASHELRTPLTAIQAETEVGLRDPKLTLKEAKELLRSNLEETKRLSALTNSLLELSSGERSTLELEPVVLAESVKRSIAQVEAMRAAKGIDIANSLIDETVLGSPVRLEELFVILLDNAIKYSPDGGKVVVSAKKHAKTIEVTVRDTGRGIKASDLPHIFDRFYRSDTSRSKQNIEGHGLGLSIAKQIVDAHHGQIHASSAIGKGTTFFIRLQAAK